MSQPHSVSVSTDHGSSGNQSQHRHLRDYIWEEFENLKAEVDLDRDAISLQRSPKSKGQLKEKAPLPWLSWSAPSGQSGQTRNKANFIAIWDRVMAEASLAYVHGAAGDATVWVNSVLLPPEPDAAVVWSDDFAPEPHDRYADHLHEAGANLAEKMIVPVGMSRWDRRPVVVIS
ncbi:uncharacterized protein HMPREF1541_10410 [Cyphellophora europaea CBS 101466]|uniref:Uncharacterized protein n=1 Tax=Cyphellophora europaea (strain CBS 101466) TaxID=1220924 RepID=W2S7Y0_CYPE1|nr:uncharacterized protein HMPREF1541_10410 [Cyphellophora europaea CBS 101466]ETN44740.1 hypothetical protein HMPREF1541_10410 [Cyphellophora europaea CBS 101466]